MWEENEGNRKFVEDISEGTDVEMEQALQNYRTAGREVLGWDQGQADMESGVWRAVEARRKGRGEEQEQRRQEEPEQRDSTMGTVGKQPEQKERRQEEGEQRRTAAQGTQHRTESKASKARESFGEEEELGETSGKHRRAGGDGCRLAERYGQAEEVQVLSEGEMRDVGRTRPRKAKERVTEERVNMKAKEELEAKEDTRLRTQ